MNEPQTEPQLFWERGRIWSEGKEERMERTFRYSAWCTSVGRQVARQTAQGHFFCFCAPWESKDPFLSEIIKDGLGQEVGDGGEGRMEEQ